MSVPAQGAALPAMTIEECQRLQTPLRQDLEILDYEIRRLVARIRKDARDAGADDTAFVTASSTILLSIAATLLSRAAEDRRANFDAGAFAASAGNAALWAQERRLKCFVGGEA
ncbi:hypothetical protein [Methylocystis parvus]|uniref:Uncharacterized protein n=1 Tax=Methylocystis parvus TaxID=134 RepID=A0A6B8MBL2_9HYPH|nr:hypothetical protein [Methylocystis parvus]QGM98010.1 hypothetical protein F7D14_11330 [Methylocystis parvus]WBK01674.1 hypothetical protein MMG94_08240 [Methylocystis parvus OBBP]